MTLRFSREPLSLKGLRRHRFSYYLYTDTAETVKIIARELRLSKSELIQYLIEAKSGEIREEFKKRKF